MARLGLLGRAVLVLAVAVAACGPAASTSTPPASAGADIVVSTAGGTELRFEPDKPMRAGGTNFSLLFQNASTLPHNLTFSNLEARTATIVAPGSFEAIKLTVPGPGTYPFVCTIHPGMAGTLMVH